MKHLLLYLVAIGILICGAWYALAWWKARPLSFHESWSEEQRLELTQMYHLLQDLNDDTTREDQAMLRRVAATGRGDIYTPQGFSAAHLAAHMSFLSLLKDLVLRGADPNMVQRTSPEHPESVFQTAMACISPDIEGRSERAPQSLRLETLAWLLEHGADINTNISQTILIAQLSDMVDEWREAPDSQPGATVEWLLEHGLQLKSEKELHQLTFLMHLKGSLPTIRRLWAAGYLPDTQETRDQLLIRSLDTPCSDTPTKARWALAMGADAASALPACCANIGLYGDKIDDSEVYNICLQALELLLSHGVKPEEPLLYAPHAEPQRSLYLDLLGKYQLLPDHD